jgi:drug/metabolite transporter (DMT)-like permease
MQKLGETLGSDQEGGRSKTGGYFGLVLGTAFLSFSPILVVLADATPQMGAVFRCVYALPALAILRLREAHRPKGEPPARLFPLLLGALLAADLLALHLAIELLGAGLATAIGATQVLFVGGLISIMDGVRWSPKVLPSSAGILCGTTLVAGVFDASPLGSRPGLGALLALVAALTFSVVLIALRNLSKSGAPPASTLFDMTLMAAVVMALTAWATGSRLTGPAEPIGHLWLALLALVSQVAGWWIILTRLSTVSALSSAGIITLQPVGVLLLAFMILSETPSSLQFLGVVAILVSVWHLARSQEHEQGSR